MSAGRSRDRRLDDPRAEPLEIGDPRLGRVARLGLAPVGEIGSPAQQADRELRRAAARARHGRRAPTRGGRRPPPFRPIGPTVSSDGQSGKTPSSGTRPQRDFSPTVPQAADGSRIEQPVSVPIAEVDEPRGERRRVAGRRATGRPPRMERVVHRAVPRVRAEHAPGELGQVALADDDRAGVEHTLHDACVPGRNVVGVDPRAVRRADAGRVDQILDEQRPPGERPVGGAAQRLVEPGDRGVEGVDHGTTATASSSIIAPGTASDRTSTIVPAGRTPPKTCRHGCSIRGRSSIAVR